MVKSLTETDTPKAITATAHKLARIVYNLVRFGWAYMRKEEEAYAEQIRGQQEKHLRRRAKELGYELVKPQPTAENASSALEQPSVA